MESSAQEWFDSDEAKFQMRTAVRNSTVLWPQARLVLETLMVLMSLGAVMGNILVIAIVAATKTFHTVTSILIINLAISDFLVGIGVMPFVAVSIINNGWVNCNDLCLYVGYTSSVYCTASVLTLAAIALDRYFSIVDCLRYDSRCTIWRTALAVLWIWLQAMVTSCPPLLGWSNISFVAPMYSCAVNWANSPSYTVIMASLTFLLPAIVILFCYVKIVRVARYHARRIHSLEEHLQRNRTPSVLNLQHSFMDSFTPSKLVYHVSGRFVMDQLDVPGEISPDAPSEMSSKTAGGRLHSFLAQIHSSSPQNPNQTQHHGVLRLFLVIAAFFLCWMPYISVALVQATETALSRPSSLVPPSAVTFSYLLVLFNSDINPLLYALLSKRFQVAFQSLRSKIQARLGRIVRRGGGVERSTVGGGGESDPSEGTTHCSTAHFRNDGEPAYPSVFTLSSQLPNSFKERLNNVLPVATSSRPVCHKCGGQSSRMVDHLQVPSKQHERNRLPYSAATKKKQATFFYGKITVRVEHDIC
ncbi:5-hydroxytryptamine receptor 1D [Carassius gibelio]|uniref:5-hydroxytryptamine receptor 1D n=1 Tax=Carassius gibelio TaxID=101364 RepID=UPI002277E819|nr:5-hydroxytryptamine receptor 1D [Carassius gibelio]